MRKGVIWQLAIVLITGKSSVEVTYLASFRGKDGEEPKLCLPTKLDKSMWYPISPAENEGHFAPLPTLENNKAHWASLRRKQTITVNPVGYFYLV